MNIHSVFNDLGIDAMTGVRLMEALNLSSIDFNSPTRFQKFQEIIDYFKNVPEDTQQYLISKVTMKGLGDKLDKVFEYTQLLSKKERLGKELETVRKESSILPAELDQVNSGIIRSSLAQKELGIASSIQTVSNELSIYEK